MTEDDVVRVQCGKAGCARLLLTVISITPTIVGRVETVEIEAFPGRSRAETSIAMKLGEPVRTSLQVEEMEDAHIPLRCKKHGLRMADGAKIAAAVRRFGVLRVMQYATAEDSPVREVRAGDEDSPI